jgi:hypothetical protein
MQIFLEEAASRHPDEKIVMILDGAGRYASKTLRAPDTIRLLPLPAYAPKLNPVEHLWDELREKFFNNLVFDSINALEDHSNPLYTPWSRNATASARLSGGRGLLTHFCNRNGISAITRLLALYQKTSSVEARPRKAGRKPRLDEER